MKASTLVGGSVLTSLMAGVPWGVVLAVVVLGLVVTFVLGLAQLVIPQDSGDRVLLWEKILEYRRPGRGARSPGPVYSTRRRRPGAGPADRRGPGGRRRGRAGHVRRAGRG